jgi:hypothetical protein
MKLADLLFVDKIGQVVVITGGLFSVVVELSKGRE